MRGLVSRGLLVSLGLWFVANAALAAGPQFTGLLNTYNQSDPFFGKTGNSLAIMDPDGPIAGSVVPLRENWSDIVVPPDNHAWYTLTHQEVYSVNPATGSSTRLFIDIPGISEPDKGWTVGAAWDTTRNRLVVGSLS